MAQAQQGSGFRIVAREDYSDVTYMLEVAHPAMAKAAQPGQFVIGTAKKVICVGGGLGVAPVYPQARAYKAAGAYVIGVIGFRNRSLMFWRDKFAAVCDELIICTDDGSEGIQGLVTKGIEQAVARHADIDEVVAIGPPIMMKGCAEATRAHGIRTMVSLNPVMVDGTGMCGGCRVKVGEQVKFACVDGPDFDGHQVDFDDLMSRLVRYRRAERDAMERWTESCRIRAGDASDLKTAVLGAEADMPIDVQPSTDG